MTAVPDHDEGFGVDCGDHVDDAELMDGLVQGNEESLRMLVCRYGSHVMAVSQRILGNRHDAEDVAAEVFVEMWTKRHRYDASRSTPRSYILLLARSRAIDRYRAIAVAPSALRNSNTTVMHEIAETDKVAPGLRLDQEELRVRARQAISELDADQRTSLELAFYEGLTYSQIAIQLGKPLGTIKSTIRRGLAKLKGTLQEFRSGDSQ